MPRIPNASLELGLKEIRAQEEIARAGYRVPGKPQYDIPAVPLNLTQISDDELMTLYTQLTHWSAHIAGQLCLQEISERYANSAYDLAYAQVFSSLARQRALTKESSVTLAKQETIQDSEIQTLQQDKDAIYARRKILGIMYGNITGDSALVSRELTRRTERGTHERRVDKYTA